MRPDHGGRLEFKLELASQASARYALTILTPHAELSTVADVTCADGSITLAEWQGGVPPAWLLTVAQALLRTLWRNHAADGDWPRRVTRWRPEPKP